MTPVIINEFEIEAQRNGERSRSEQPDAAASPAATPPAQSPVRQIEQVLRRRHERDLRVWAH